MKINRVLIEIKKRSVGALFFDLFYSMDNKVEE